MTDTNSRKAVVTTAQVAEAFASYVVALGRIGQDITGHEFDKGHRGKGFAEYDSAGNVVRSFDSKEDALTTYGLTAKGMWLVLDTLPQEKEAPKVAAKADKTAA